MSKLFDFVKCLGLSAFIMAAGAAHGATYVYVSNAEDGNIGMYAMESDGTLKPGPRVPAGKIVMPMAVSPDKRFLFAAIRTKPFSAVTYAIDPKSGTLKELSRGPLAESLPYISVDKTGRFLLGAGYGGNVISVNTIGKDGQVGIPQQVIPTARNPHCIITDRTNHYVYVPHLGSDQIFQFVFDETTGKLTANTPPVVQIKSGYGPRHLIISGDNRFAYLVTELKAMVITLAIDQKTGLLSVVSEVSALPPGSKLKPGAPRVPVGMGEPERDVSNDIWASDLHLTPDGKFLYVAERTSSMLAAFSVDGSTGKLTYLSSTPVEKQPRGFRIDPNGKYIVVSGELSDTISVYKIETNGALTMLKKYPTGKDSNWVEIVSFDK